MIFVSMPHSPQSVTQVFSLLMLFKRAFLVAQMVKNLPAMPETWVQSSGGEDPRGEGNDNPFQYS